MNYMDKNRAQFVLEFLTFWVNGTTAEEVGGVLGMTREAVQRTVIGPYKKQFPGTIDYDRGRHRTKWLDSAALKVCPGDPAAVAAIAQSEALFARFADVIPLCDAPVEDVGLVTNLLLPPEVEPDVEGFRALFAALVRRGAVQLDYLAKSGRLSMTFSPHSLVRTSFRLHFRGYCDMNDGRPGIYIDAIPDRVLHAFPPESAAYVSGDGDAEWRRKVRVIARLDNALPDRIVAALRREYCLPDGHAWRTRPVRAAVAPYVMDAFEARRVHGWDGPVWRTEIEA